MEESLSDQSAHDDNSLLHITMPLSQASAPITSIALVQVVTTVLWCTFSLLDIALSVPSMLSNETSKVLQLANCCQENSRERKTVVVVGANFAGLAALRKLSHCSDILRIILIDQRSYFEYTPGILRLFCEPDHLPHLAKDIPQNPRTHQVIQGKVTSIFQDVDSLSDATRRKTLTYQSTLPDSENIETQLQYDYLILATGATYTQPISPNSDEAMTLQGRHQEWKSVNTRLEEASHIVILGGGAVGVELAAEIVDHYSGKKNEKKKKQVTLLDGNAMIVSNFPKAVGEYAHQWLTKRGVNVRLGQRIQSWDETSCTLSDGTVIEADIVYNCLGNRPNSKGLESSSSEETSPKSPFLFNRRRQVVVDDTLQARGDVEVQDFPDGSVFCVGDVASSPHGNENQAFQAETQGGVAAMNVIRLAKGATNEGLCRYPDDIAGSKEMPLIFVLSLGQYDGVLGFNGLVLPGPLAAVTKWILEFTKVLHMQGRLFGRLLWKVGDAVVLFLNRTCIKPLSVNGKHA